MTLHVPGEQVPDAPIELPSLESARLYLTRGSLLYEQACSNMLRDQSTESHHTLNLTVDVCTNAFGKLIDVLPSEGPLEAYAEQIVSMHIDEQHARALFLNSLLGKEAVGTMDLDMSEAAAGSRATLCAEKLAAMKLKVAQQVKDLFTASMLEDTNIFLVTET